MGRHVLSHTHLNTALVQSEPHLKPSALRTDKSWVRVEVAVKGSGTSAGPGEPFIGDKRPNYPSQSHRPEAMRQVPEHLADIADTQVDDLECVVTGTAEQMQLIVAEAQGGDAALHRDDLCAAGPPKEQGQRWG